MSVCDALLERFRCPDDLAGLAWWERSPEAGDELQSMRATGTSPTAVVEYLRWERYAQASREDKLASPAGRVIQKLYYTLHPFMSKGVRKPLQRLYLRNWDRRRFPSWPVDSTVEHVLETALSLSLQRRHRRETPFIWFWPDGAYGCISVTHDVESGAGVRFIPRLMDIDQQYGIRSSFQLVPGGRYKVPESLLNVIRGRGFELNVQDLRHDGNLFSDRAKFLMKARLINQRMNEWDACGFRAGRLYRNMDWYEALNAAYDMSVPNVAHLDPQHGGCCTVFPYFIGKILELPLTTTQDYALFHILGEYTVDLWKQQLELVMKQHGFASFLIHPDYIRDARTLGVYKALLSMLLEWQKEAHVWIAVPGEVNQWWRARSEMRLVPSGSRWRIEGPERERARIAYARAVNGRIAYALEATDLEPVSISSSTE
jgi:hypothetical protein